MDSKEKEQSLKLAEHYFRDNNYSFAKYILGKIIKIDANNSKANELLAYIYGNSGEFDISFELLNLACSQNECSSEALYYLGSTQLERGLFGEAIETFTKSIFKGGEFFEVLHDLATAQAHMRDITSALNNYYKCLNLNNSSHELFFNIARIYDDLKLYEESIVHYDKALSLKPDFAVGWLNKGGALRDLKRYDEAIAHFDTALSLKSDINWAYGDLIHTKMKICSWIELADSLEIISQKIMANEKVIQPFSLLALSDNVQLHKKTSEVYARDKYPKNPVLEPILKRPKSQKIRVGYFSADFGSHPVSFLTAELYELHDSNKFEIIAFSSGVDDKSPMRSRLKKAFNQFIDVSTMPDIDIAKLSRELHIDILVDLSGHTTGSRTGVFSHRAAPIQVNWLGYPGTMGADYIDYIMADKTLIPLDSQACYSEKVVYLSNSYQVNDRRRLISDRQFTKQELGLPENGFVFCCFNNNYKITPTIFDSWMRILSLVHGSILWLLADNPIAKENLIKEADARGIDSSRLVFAERVPISEHLARHRQADLFLDTLPYNAHTTTSDALWSGLPVLTLMGKSFAGRVAASLLNAIGLPELITSTQEEYEALAIELAMNPIKLADIKLKLAKNRLSAPLFDTPLFTKNLEAGYIKMIERYQNGLQPDHILIV
jgi:predicted O-linked N-acetylglucosamine transferase (SPINDLY family)